MEVKKSHKADLESKRPIGLLIGFVLAMALIFAVLEWTVRRQDHFTAGRDVEPDTASSIGAKMMREVLLSEKEVNRIIEIESRSGTSEAEVMEEEMEKGRKLDGVNEEPPKELVDEMPEFPGGMEACLKYLSIHTRYPEDARENGIQGRVLVQFVVAKDGTIEDVTVLRTVYPSLDKEAMRVIRTMPQWVPGRLYGEAVRVKYILPVTFKIN